jgi:hypothetical protein
VQVYTVRPPLTYCTVYGIYFPTGQESEQKNMCLPDFDRPSILYRLDISIFEYRYKYKYSVLCFRHLENL